MNKIALLSGIAWFLPIYNQKPFAVSDATIDVDNIVYVFSHGLASTNLQGHCFSHLAHPPTACSYNKHWMVGTPLVLFNYNDAKNDERVQWHAHHVNLGQEDDIKTLEDACNYARENFPERRLVLGGVSRGATTIINYVATKKPHDIAALVLECPFDSFDSIVHHLLKQAYIHWLPLANKLAKKYMEYTFPRLKAEGIVPIHVAHTISYEIPILFLHSRIDKIVPVNSSRLLYLALIKEGHEKTYLCEVETGSHARLLKGKEGYLSHGVIHAFYKHHGLPHDKEAAAYAYNYFLSHCHPSQQEIDRRIKNYRINGKIDEYTN